MKQRIILLPVILTSVLLALSCQPEVSDSEPEPTASKMTGTDSDFFGLSLSDAEALATQRDLLHRVTMVDGEPRLVTGDFRPNRVNFEIVGGKVVKTSRG